MHLVLHQPDLGGFRFERIRGHGARADERVDRGTLAHAGLAQEKNRAGEAEVRRRAFARFRRCSQRDGSVESARVPASTSSLLLLATLQLFRQLQAVNHLGDYRVARGLSEPRGDSQKVNPQTLQLVRHHCVFVLGVGLGVRLG